MGQRKEDANTVSQKKGDGNTADIGIYAKSIEGGSRVLASSDKVRYKKRERKEEKVRKSREKGSSEKVGLLKKRENKP